VAEFDEAARLQRQALIMDTEELLRESEAALARPIVSRHVASALAMNLFLLASVAGLADDPRVIELRARFEDAVHRAGFRDLAATQASYAIRLATAPGRLEYEEMHKVLSLANEIHALRQLGFSLDGRSDELDASLHDRFAIQRREARMAAEDKVEDWNRGLWWFAENLK
jgi:hypothetical protein